MRDYVDSALVRSPAFRKLHTPEFRRPFPNSNRTGITHPDGAVFTYAHDALGRLSGVYQGAGLATPLAWFAYTAQGLPQSRIEGTGSSLAYSYDAIGRLTGIADAFNWSPANGTLTFAHNPAGQIASRTQSNDGYAWAGAYTVDRPYTTNGLNQYSAAGSASFSYDANGNLTSDGSANFTYDVENRLVAAGGSRTAALHYDPLGRLHEVVGAATTRFLHDGDALIGEYNLGGTMTARYVHGSDGGADDPLIWYGNGTVYWLHSDHQGSITAIANIDGNLMWLNAYDEYGIPRAGNQGRFQYTGQAWLGELGMYHYKARIYSPTLGRFLQTDPVGYDDQYNLYAYVGNDPVNRTDPMGTTCVEVGKGGFKCIVDDVDRSRLTGTQLRQLNHFESQYTAAVNRLRSPSNQNASIQVRQSGHGLGAFTISRREAAANLIARTFVYDPDNPRTASATATAFQEGRAGGKVATYVTDRGLAIGNTVTVVHDGALHGSSQEASGGLAGMLGQDPWREGHQVPYRDSSCQLLEQRC